MRLKRLILLLLFPLAAQASPKIVDWLDLLPEEDYQAMLEMPEIDHDWGEEMEGGFTQSLRQRDKSLPEVMYSTRVVATYDGPASTWHYR